MAQDKSGNITTNSGTAGQWYVVHNGTNYDFEIYHDPMHTIREKIREKGDEAIDRLSKRYPQKP